jgi:PBSX family phage terminase large subunit
MVRTLLWHQGEFVSATESHPAIVGGLGSGKTEGGTARILKLMLEDPEADFFYGMPTYDLLRLRAIPGMEIELSAAGLDYVVNKSASEISVEGHGKIIFRSYDRPERIIAFEVAHGVVDEIDTVNKEKAELIWRKISERVRQTTPNLIKNTLACVTTPDQGYSGFVYDRWVKNPGMGYRLIKASTYDNPFLPEGYTDQILANYDPILADLYLRGEFVSLTQDKQFWAYNRESCGSDVIINDDDNVVLYSIDFNIGGTCMVVWKRIGDALYAVDEIVANNTQDAITKIDSKYSARKICFPDASGGNESANADYTSLQLISRAGHRINAPRKNPSVKSSINAVNNLLSKERLFVNSKRCPSVVEALESLGYDDSGKPEKSNKHPAPDDWGDNVRYIVDRLYPVRVPTQSIRRK